MKESDDLGIRYFSNIKQVVDQMTDLVKNGNLQKDVFGIIFSGLMEVPDGIVDENKLVLYIEDVEYCIISGTVLNSSKSDIEEYLDTLE